MKNFMNNHKRINGFGNENSVGNMVHGKNRKCFDRLKKLLDNVKNFEKTKKSNVITKENNGIIKKLIASLELLERLASLEL